MSGFIYLWYDRKHKRFYVGSHWGTPDDGYICSSKWMKEAYRRRPQDFRRRIIATVTTSRRDLLNEEYRWLAMIKEHEIKTRYYNLKVTTAHWYADDEQRKTVGQKIAAKMIGKPGRHVTPHTEEAKARISQRTREAMRDPAVRAKCVANGGKGMLGKKHSEETKAKMRAAQLARFGK